LLKFNKILIGLLLGVAGLAYAQSPYVTVDGQLQGPNGLPVANGIISLQPTQTFFVAGSGGYRTCYGYVLQINGVQLVCGDTVDFNATIPAAPTNGYPIQFSTSNSLGVDYVSLALVGNGNAADCLVGTGVFVTCPGGGGGGSTPTGPLPPAPLESQGSTITPVYANGITFHSTAEMWTQTLGSALTAGTSNAITLTPCPVGIDTTSGYGYQVFLSGGGNSEAVNVVPTGGDCTSGASSGTIHVVPFFSYASGTVSSASSGIQETINAACGVYPSGSHVAVNNGANITIPGVGPIIYGDGLGFQTNTYTVQGSIFQHCNNSYLHGHGVSLYNVGRGPAIIVGDLITATDDWIGNTVDGFTFVDPINYASNPSYAGVQITNTVATEVTSPNFFKTITTATAHGFRPGDIVSIMFTDNANYWGDAVVYDCGNASSPATPLVSCAGSQTTFRIAGTQLIATQATPGVVALEYSAILDNAQNTRLTGISNGAFGNYGLFNNFIDVWGDENAVIDQLGTSGPSLNHNYNWTSSYVFAGALYNLPGQNAPVITLQNSTITANYTNCVTDLASNGLYVDNTVCQAQGLWQVRASNEAGNYQGATIRNIYSEQENLNPGCSPSCPTGAKTPFPGTGYAGLIAGSSAATASYKVEGNGTPSGAPATGGTGSTAYQYFIVANDTTTGTRTSPMEVLDWDSTLTDSIPVTWPRVSNAGDSITYDVLRSQIATQSASGVMPYAGGCNGGSGNCGYVAQGILQSTACGGGLVCSFTDVQPSTTVGHSGTASAWPALGNWTGQLNFWPGAIVSVSRTVQVDNLVEHSVGVGLDGNAILSTNNCNFNVYAAASPGGWVFCPNSALSGDIQNPTGTIFVDGSTAGANSNVKGRVIVSEVPGGTLAPHDVFTVIDSNPNLTLASISRAPASAQDSAIGTDATGAITASALAFRSPVYLSFYIDSLFDNASWKMRLSAEALTTTVPITTTGLTVGTLNGCGFYTAGVLSASGSCGGGLTSFTVGNLSPIFTASLGSNPTTAPALTFSLTDAAAYSVLNNATGSSAAPAYTATPVVNTLTANTSLSIGSPVGITAPAGASWWTCGQGSTSGFAGAASTDSVACDGPTGTLYANGTGSPYNPAMFHPLQGSDLNVLTAGTVSGTAALLCTDANGGATTSSCPSAGVSSVFTRTGAVVAANNDYDQQQIAPTAVISPVSSATSASTSGTWFLTSGAGACTEVPISANTFTITLPVSTSQPPTGKCVTFTNYGAGTVTLALNGQLLNGGSSNILLLPASAIGATWATLKSDGTNFVEWGVTNYSPTSVSCTQATCAGSATNLIASTANAMYAVDISVACVSSASAATATITIGYTDPSGTTHTIAPAAAATCTTLGSASIASVNHQVFRAESGTAITYAATTANTPTYQASVTLYQETAN
jgi:hypothetical protein